MVVAHNMLAMNANRMFGINTNARAKSTEKLSSGYKINRSADDAAGLAISEKMRRQIRGLTQGVENTQDGVSMIQVGDGALAEVSDMLHRLEELSVKAANDTNTYEDRQFIQQEINELIVEIDRIGDTTTFNDVPLFKGKTYDVYEDDGTPVIEGSVPVNNFSISDVALGIEPFNASSDPDRLNLTATISNGAAKGIDYKLIYDGGSTSNSSLMLTNSTTGSKEKVYLNQFTITPGSYSYDANTSTWSREMRYKDGDFDIALTQNIHAVEASNTEKYYELSYNFTNLSSTDTVSGLFMFNADTSYGGDNAGDRKETYYINGNKVSKNTIYSKDDSPLTPKSQGVNAGSGIKYTSIPNSFSIINEKEALSFSEKITLPNTSDVIDLSIGYYNVMREWEDYSKGSNGVSVTMISNLLHDTEGRDLEFNIIWNLGDMNPNASKSESLRYGLQTVANDANLNNVTVQPSRSIVKKHESEFPVWIQSGAEAYQGMNIIFGEMNSDVLGISNMNVLNARGSNKGINQVKEGLKYVSELRSNLGAQQNRLEHTIRNESNIVENTTAAESKIRDTDMAKEMVNMSNLNILDQVGQSMLAQANQNKQGILSLLQ